jgi:hypothetical protein
MASSFARSALHAARAGRTSVLRLSMETGTKLVDTVHAFVSGYIVKRFRASLAQSIVTASYELLENALNYGSVTGPVIFEIFDLEGVPEIEVSNVAVTARLNQLVARVDALNANAAAVYQEEFRKTLLPNGPRAMLGLARIAHEGGMSLAYEIVDQRVTVRAWCRP